MSFYQGAPGRAQPLVLRWASELNWEEMAGSSGGVGYKDGSRKSLSRVPPAPLQLPAAHRYPSPGPTLHLPCPQCCGIPSTPWAKLRKQQTRLEPYPHTALLPMSTACEAFSFYPPSLHPGNNPVKLSPSATPFYRCGREGSGHVGSKHGSQDVQTVPDLIPRPGSFCETESHSIHQSPLRETETMLSP